MGIASPENYLDIADGEVRAAQALREDLLAMLFPHGGAMPSELLQTRVKQKIQAVVNGIEAELDGGHERGHCWHVLARSGLLRETALIDFALARVAEENLRKSLSAAEKISPLSQLPVQLFDHENARISQLAKTLLNAELLTADDQKLFHRLEPELLHLLCWRVVAASQETEGRENEERQAKAQALLLTHSTDRDPSTAARKLVFFLGSESRNALLDPRKAGLQLFVAALAQEFSVRSDMLFQLIGAPSIAPLLVVLKAANVPLAQLPSMLIALRNIDGSEQSPAVAEIYGGLDPVDARAQLSVWAIEEGA